MLEIIKEAVRIGETNESVGGHLPRLLGDIDPLYVTHSTSIAQMFLSPKMADTQVLLVVTFHWLEELRYLDQEDMLIQYYSSCYKSMD